MGCDIHPYVEVRQRDGSWKDFNAPDGLHDRTYGRFAFLTGGEVRNYSGVPEVLPKPRGFPKDGALAQKEGAGGHHSASYLTVTELLAVDYGQKFTDIRSGATEVTLREFLGENWFEILAELQLMGPNDGVRIVFDFDS